MRVSDYTQRLERSGILNAHQEALWLMSYALGVSTSQILARNEFTDAETAKIENVISRREAGEPMQYIMGEADFFGRDFHVGKGVLIPRHDTETLIRAVIKHIPSDDGFSFIDWGTGSGCIAVTLLLEFQKSYAYLIETSSEARNYARINLERYDVADRAIILSDMSGLKKAKFIVSNPPYIPSREISALMKTVRDYEPHSALDGGEDGMNFYREIFQNAESLFCEYIFLETGSINQVKSLEILSHNFISCDFIMDDGNFQRCLVFRRRNIYEKIGR